MKRKWIGTGIVTMALALVLAGCGSSNNAQGTAPVTGGTTPTDSASGGTSAELQKK